MKREHNLLIGERSAEIIKMTIGSAYPDRELRKLDVKGRNLIRGIPTIVEINAEEIREAIMEPVNIIVATIKNVLENAPPELAGDIVERGIVLTGGGALLAKLDYLIKEETGIPIAVADDPLSAVARGAGMALDHIDILKEVSFQS